MRISVVIPSYNSERFLPETVESVLNQTIEDWELIIVNDGSTDQTGEMAERLARCDTRIRVIHQSNAGLSGARNAGYRAANTELPYVCFLDSDDVLEPDALETLSTVLEEQPDKAGAHGLALAIDKESKRIRPGELEARFRNRRAVVEGQLVNWPVDNPTTFACEVFSNYIPTPGTLLIRRTTMEKTLLFDERMSGCADWDQWLRICRIGDIAFVNRVSLQYRLHDDNMSAKSKLMADDELRMRQKLLTWPGETSANRRLARWGCRYRSLEIAQCRLGWVKDALRQGKIIQAAKQLRHASRLYLMYR
jgi:glycosyltransferase involved in cell wall biosynthesis